MRLVGRQGGPVGGDGVGHRLLGRPDQVLRLAPVVQQLRDRKSPDLLLHLSSELGSVRVAAS
jgi:hypothetical protein